MSSSVKGVQGIICRESPLAFYVHCNCHILNLVIVKACSIQSVRNMAGTITETANFFNFSAKRQRFLESVISLDASSQQRKVKLKDLCRTRWIQRHEAYETFFELLPSFVKVLETIVYGSGEEGSLDWSWDADTKTKANGLLHAICSFEFIVTILCVLKILTVIKPISIKLQKKTNDIVQAYSMVREVLQELQAIREEADTHFKVFYDESVALAYQFEVEPKVPRRAARQRNRSNHPSTSPEEYFRCAIFLPFIDHTIQEMST